MNPAFLHLTTETRARLARWLASLVLAVLFLLGVVHWVWFLNFGDIPWHLIDWPKERAYCDVLRQAFHEGIVPYHMGSAFHGTDRFLGVPEINLSPQVLLLAFVEPGTFVVANTLLLYMAGFIGCLMIRARYQLGLVSFAVLWLLFNFNGHITAHLAASHPMWAGYFLLPFFLLWLLQWNEEGPSAVLVVKLALVIVAILLQGSFHLAVWCWMLMALCTAFQPRWWKEGLAVIALSGLLSACRIVPAVVAFWDVKGHPPFPGYRDVGEVFEAFAVLRDASKEVYMLAAGPAFWWEYDYYIGLVGLAVVLWFGVVSRWIPGSQNGEISGPPDHSLLFAPLAVMAFLSLGPYWGWLARLPIPLMSSERVPSRFLLLPMLLLLLIAVIRLNDWLRRAPRPALFYVLLLCGLAELTRALVQHSIAWHMAHYPDRLKEFLFQPRPGVAGIANRPDPVYVASIGVGLALTAATAAAWGWWSWSRPGEPETEPEPAAEVKA